MKRRQFIQAGLAVAGSFALGRDFWKRAYAAPAIPGPGPFGGLLGPDENGLLLPPGFRSRKIATAYSPVALKDGGESAVAWHRAPDGGGVIPQPDGGWIYVSNSEIPIIADECADDPASPFCGEQGGCSAIRFDAEAQVVDAYPILQGTNNNCAGGVTPWGTWLSCEENFFGFVYECDPTGSNLPIRLAAMGQFSHEAAAVDPIRKAIYMTEDTGDGALYRFIPLSWPDDGRPDLSLGELQVAVVGNNPPTRIVFQDTIREFVAETPLYDIDEIPWDELLPEVTETEPGKVTWQTVPNPLGLPLECRYQVPTAAVFKGGEGCWYDDGMVFFTCKGSNRVWGYDTVNEMIDIIYDANMLGESAPLTGVDNLVVHPDTHDLYVAEDGGNMEVVMITDDRIVAPVLRYPVPHSEIAGPAFDPSGTRLYFASQAKRHNLDENGEEVRGEIFEVTGPFNRTGLTPEVPTALPDSADPQNPPTSSGGSIGLLSLAAISAAALARKLLDEQGEDKNP